MLKKILTFKIVLKILVLIFFCLIFQQTNVIAKKKANITVKLANKNNKSISNKDKAHKYNQNNISLIISGGYFIPYKNVECLKPGMSLMISTETNNLGNTIFGLGIDLSYAKAEDKEFNGYIIYISLLPGVTATFDLYNNLKLQFKLGPGVTNLYSKIDNVKENSLSMTLNSTVCLFYLIKSRYIIGIKYLYNYYFQIHSSSSNAYYFNLGYIF